MVPLASTNTDTGMPTHTEQIASTSRDTHVSEPVEISSDESRADVIQYFHGFLGKKNFLHSRQEKTDKNEEECEEPESKRAKKSM